MNPTLQLEQLDFMENDLISREATAGSFKEWWGLRQQRNELKAERSMLRDAIGKARVEKKKTNEDDLTEARALIALYNKRHKTATQTIKAIADQLGKDEVDAARIYWTETKRADTKATRELGGDLGFTKYKVILSPSACKVCRKKTDEGQRVFKTSEIKKTGYGHAPPFHPNCYCILVPHVD